MCGIAGIFNLNKEFGLHREESQKLIKRMIDSLKHRGPDDSGMYLDHNIALGHQRLSILDLSKNGRQPMSDSQGKVFVVFNGEIYNYQKIKEELIKKNYQFKSNSDTEVIIYSYLEWGIRCLERFNGMFSLALYDKNKGKLYLIRDRLGIKPLYYLIINNKIIFSSEIKAILFFPAYDKKLNLKAVSSYLSYRYPLGQETFFQDILSLEPGHFLELKNNGEFMKKKYWDLKLKRKIKDKGEKYYKIKIKQILEESVKKRMISDVPFGAYLSGGLDSSAIVSIMAKNSPYPIKTFTIGFKEGEFNEFYFSKLVADRYKTDHKEIILSAEKYLHTMKKLIKFKDAPLGVPNEVPLYLMSKELKKDITVVLSGEGADETFSGYGKLFRSPFDYQRIKILQKIPWARKLPWLKKVYKNMTIKYQHLDFKNEFEHFLNQYTYFPSKEKFSLFSEKMIKEIDKDKEIINLLKKHFYRYDVPYYRKINYVFEKFHLPGLLQRVDNCTMATSVEGRVPFVDHQFVEFMMNVPTKYKMKWKSFGSFLRSLSLNSEQISEKEDIPKYILKETVKECLPLEVITRKKKGFPVPLNIWFKDDFIKLARKELLSPKAKINDLFNPDKLETWINAGDSNNFGQKLWMILNLEYFLRTYF